MKATEQHIEDLHFEHKLWLSEADFYRDELRIYQKQVEEVGKRNTSAEVKQRVQYFEHEFKARNKELEALHQEISSHEHSLADVQQSIPTKTVNAYSAEHVRMRKKTHDFKERYSVLKNEFMVFLEDWL